MLYHISLFRETQRGPKNGRTHTGRGDDSVSYAGNILIPFTDLRHMVEVASQVEIHR